MRAANLIVAIEDENDQGEEEEEEEEDAAYNWLLVVAKVHYCPPLSGAALSG